MALLMASTAGIFNTALLVWNYPPPLAWNNEPFCIKPHSRTQSTNILKHPAIQQILLYLQFLFSLSNLWKAIKIKCNEGNNWRKGTMRTTEHFLSVKSPLLSESSVGAFGLHLNNQFSSNLTLFHKE